MDDGLYVLCVLLLGCTRFYHCLSEDSALFRSAMKLSSSDLESAEEFYDLSPLYPDLTMKQWKKIQRFVAKSNHQKLYLVWVLIDRNFLISIWIWIDYIYSVLLEIDHRILKVSEIWNWRSECLWQNLKMNVAVNALCLLNESSRWQRPLTYLLCTGYMVLTLDVKMCWLSLLHFKVNYIFVQFAKLFMNNCNWCLIYLSSVYEMF